MSTLVVRLSGPLQSWGEVAPHSERTTLPYPTYAGLMGLTRAALGHGRYDDPADVAWLHTLNMSIRVDSPGRLLSDFHTVNPRRDRNGNEQFTVPIGVMNGNGTARPWIADGRLPTAVSRRHYLADAAFLWLISSNAANMARLTDALTNPVWALSLGRKACPPDFPFVLGVYGGTIQSATKTVPRIGAEPARTTVHTLTGKAPAGSVSRTHTDRPLGSHTHDGYTLHRRHLTSVTPPVVPDRETLLTWASSNLDLGLVQR